MSTPEATRPLRVVVVSAGTSDPSSTRLLADRVAARTAALAAEHGRSVAVTTVDLRELATELAAATVSGVHGPRLTAAVQALGTADGIVASTPVYKAGASGLFTTFFQVLDDDLLIARPVVLAATAGTSRHALVVDDQLRPLFAYLRTLTAPTSLFAAPEDWTDPALGARVDRAARELVLLMDSGVGGRIRESTWRGHRHELGSAGGTETGIELDTDLMRLAAGGSAAGRPPAPAQAPGAGPSAEGRGHGPRGGAPGDGR